MKIVTAAEMREIDRRTTEEFGVPPLTLMENAGSAVAEFCLHEYPQANTIGVICGKGNNGGDGFVAARKLHEAGKTVRVLLLADPADLRGDAAEMLKRLLVQPVIARDEQELEKPEAEAIYDQELLIDAILGTGFKPPLTKLYWWAIQYFWAPSCGAPVVSVDVPSGTLADEYDDRYRTAEDAEGEETNPVARSSAVVTFTLPKIAHVFQNLTHGPILVAEIGSPPEAISTELALNAITDNEAVFTLHHRTAASNKGDFGHVLVVGGSGGKAGAAAMAGMAALRTGAGLSTVATPASVQNLVASFMPELMTEGMPETAEATLAASAFKNIQSLSERKSVLAIGPGLSRNAESAEFARQLVTESHLPIVLDADGLNAFEGRAELLDASERLLVLTPHPGEMARLNGMSVEQIQSNRIEAARTFAQQHQCVIVLKGWRTLIAEPNGRVWVNMTGNPGMASGGTGDALTGMIAGMIAQHGAGIRPILAAVHLHGLAGDVACRKLGPNAMTATDLIEHIGAAYQELFWHPRLSLLKRSSPDPWWYRERNRLI